MARTQQPTMYQLIPVLEWVLARMAAAISGAGPPAITEALVSDARAAVAQVGPEALGDERCLGTVLHVVEDQGQHDGQEHEPGGLGIEQPKYGKA